MKNNTNKNYYIQALCSILIYFLFSFLGIQKFVFEIIFKNYFNWSKDSLMFVNFMSSFLIFILLILLNYKQLKILFIDLKNNHKEYFKDNFKYYIIGLMVMMVSNVILHYAFGDISDNENSIQLYFKLYPIYIGVSAVLFAPFVEEIVFRLSFRNLIKNNKIFVFISGFIFGFLHIISDLTFPNILFLIPYSALGFAFAHIITKTNNVLVAIALHFMHNGILISLQILFLVLG